MKNKSRYERVMRQDYPRDFIPDDEWDFIESLATCKGDGVKNMSPRKQVSLSTNTACRMPKSGEDKTMAKRNTSDIERTPQQKCDYYKKRVNDPNLSEAQRNWAARRISQLCGGSSSAKSTAPSKKFATPSTAEQQNARNAGIGFGAAKAGARVNVKPENRDAFRDGVKVGKSLAKKF